LLLWILDGAFLASLLYLVASWLLDSIDTGIWFIPLSFGWHCLLIPAGLILTRALLARFMAQDRDRPTALLDMAWARTITLALISVIFFVGLLETMLDLAGYEVDAPPVIFELTDAEGVTEKSEGYADPEYIFAFRKGETYHGVMINNLGYRERDVEPDKPEGWMRVICMGDSVTAQGKPGYCGYLHEMLQADPPTPQPWEAFNMAVYGYSSVQGLRVFENQTRQLAPDIVTLFYGWNDHWLELRKDRDRMARRTGKLYAQLFHLLQDKRVFMLAHNLLTHGDLGSRVRDEPGFRVPPEDYKQTLRTFVAEIRAIDALPLLITAPRRELSKHRDFDIDFNKVHDEYAQYTRQVANELDVDLLDLHAQFADPEYDIFFSDDAIHFRQGGLQRIAQELDAKIRDMVSAASAQTP